MPKDQRLIAEVVGGRIVISIGVETLKYCHNRSEEGYDAGYGSGFLITDANGFAEDIVSRLKHEREDGSTILTDLLDRATEEAAEEGSQHCEERKIERCNVCGRELRRADEKKIGACVACMNEEIED